MAGCVRRGCSCCWLLVVVGRRCRIGPRLFTPLPKMLNPPPWKDSRAKSLLQGDILSGAVLHDMAARDVFSLRPEYQRYPFKNFVTNLRSLRQALTRNPNIRAPPPPQWKNSEAKELLNSEIISGVVTPDMDSKQVYNMHPSLYHQYQFQNFVVNLRNLREVIATNHARMIADCELYGHDMAIVPTVGFRSEPGYLPWHRSKAPTLLAEDIAKGKHKIFSAVQLHASRPEYQVFPLKQFGKFIHQEVDRCNKKEFRFQRKQKKEEQKHKKHARD
jgi:hypothetical protein